MIMNISYKLDLDRYQVMEIIEMVEQGVLTAAEVKASGRCNSEFGDILKTYVRMKIKQDGTATKAVAMYNKLMRENTSC